MEAPEEDVRPVELPLFRAAVEVLRIRMFEVEADQTDARGAEVVREEHRPISIRKAAEVPQAPEGPGLRRRHRCPENRGAHCRTAGPLSPWPWMTAIAPSAFAFT